MVHPVVDLGIPESVGSLQNVQTIRRINAVIQAQRAPFYAGKLDHIDIDKVTEPDEWAKIPILDKEQLRAMDAETFYNDFCLAPRKDIVEYWRSGGSTGRPLFYPRTQRDLQYALVGFKRALTLAGFTASDIAHMSMPLGIHPAGHLMARAGSDIDIGMVWAGGGNTLGSPAQLDLIRMFKPSAWIGMASYGIQLGNLAKSEGFDLAAGSVEKILCSAEPLSDVKRRKLAELWGAQVRDCFGMTEVMMLGCEDDEAYGFRFWTDFCYPEVLHEETMEPVMEGETGLLVVTSLVTNHATPFLRWNTGDIVTMRSRPSRGSPFHVFPLIQHAHRTAGFVKVRGVNIGFSDLEDEMFGMDMISDFRCEIVFEEDRDELDIHVEFKPGVTKSDGGRRIEGNIYRVFGVRPRVKSAARGEVAKSFEGSFKPARVQDKRG